MALTSHHTSSISLVSTVTTSLVLVSGLLLLVLVLAGSSVLRLSGLLLVLVLGGPLLVLVLDRLSVLVLGGALVLVLSRLLVGRLLVCWLSRLLVCWLSRLLVSGLSILLVVLLLSIVSWFSNGLNNGFIFTLRFRFGLNSTVLISPNNVDPIFTESFKVFSQL